MPSAAQKADSIRAYSMTWLLKAACRVYQRGAELHREHEHVLRRGGLDGLFDLSDAVPVRAVVVHRRLPTRIAA